MPIDDVREYIEKNSANGIVYIEYSYKQLGKDEKWFKDVCRVLNNNPLKIKREIFLMRMHGSQNSPYAPEDLEAINEKKGTIIEEIFINKLFKLDVYTSIVRNKIYFVGVDVANGYGSDNSAITVWDPYTLKTVAEFKSPNIGIKALIKFIYVLIRKYLPRSILIVERNANGEAVLDHLRDTEIRGNIYFDTSKDIVGANIDDKLTAQGLLAREAARRKLYGVYTQGKSREIMFSLLDEYIRNHKDSFVGNNIIDDIMKLVTIRGKIQAAAGFHDDSIMSFLMCIYVYYHGNSLHKFGFVRGALPTEEERNKGLSYGEIYDMLSDNDKEFFKDSGFSNYENDASNINIRSMIENNNRGMVSKEEFNSDVGIKPQTNFNPLSTMTPYQRKIYEEMLKAEAESRAFDRLHGIQREYEILDDDMDDGGIDLSIFDELND